MKFTMPDQLPKRVGELQELRKQAVLDVGVYKARWQAKEEFSLADVDRIQFLVDSRDKIDAAIAASVSRSRLAIHEAGHSVVATMVGGRVDIAEVYPAGVTDRDRKGGYCRYIPGNPAIAQHEHLIAAAGVVAECIWDYGQPTNWQITERLAGSHHDAEFLRRHALTAGAFASDPIREASALVHAGWPAIKSLAAQLDERGQITHENVVAALGLSEDRSLHSFEVANVRAGLRMVPQPAAVGGAGHAERL